MPNISDTKNISVNKVNILVNKDYDRIVKSSDRRTGGDVNISNIPVHRRAARLVDIAKPSDFGGQPSTIKESDGGVYMEED